MSHSGGQKFWRIAKYFVTRIETKNSSTFLLYINIYIYIIVQNTTYIHQHSDELSITLGLQVSALKQPSSGQCRTYTRYNINVLSMGFYIVYNKSEIN